MPVVYLLHWPDTPHARGSHYLGIAGSEVLINPGYIPHGQGLRRLPFAARVQLADLWTVPTLAAAVELRDRFRRQGSRRRLCSICSPGNARGAGRGNWIRPPRVQLGGESSP